MLKHDSKDSTYECPIIYQSSGDVMSYHPDLDPLSSNLYSNLQQLEYLRDTDDAKLTLKIDYPRSQGAYLIWKQSSNPTTSDQITGFTGIDLKSM